MADLAAANVTYTMKNQRKLSDSRNLNRIQLAFGDGALTYPAGGIPLSKGKMGCPTIIESLIVVDKGTSGYEFKYDQSAEKLVVFHQGSHHHDLFTVNNSVADAATTRLNVGTNALSSNTGANVTVAGANSATSGGVLARTPGAMAEPSAVALAAQTIEVEVIGY